MSIIYLVGIGTIVNTAAVLAGGVIGYIFQRLLNDKLQKNHYSAIGVAVIFIGVAGVLSQMLVVKNGQISTHGTLMATISLVIGALIGELIDIDHQFVKLGDWLRRKVGAKSDSLFIEGFVSATLTICVGAMAIIGSLQDAINHDPTMLFTKAILDGVIVAIYAASFGVGAIFSSLPLFIFQMTITLLAVFIDQFLTTAMTNGISLVGSMMIFCIGINLLLDTKIRVANMLPGLLVVIGYVALM
ncbi:DUF554 domain-containing protein [Secundilactobacillus collinoides]|uniref:DUF554 domain-containing protein n=1 Tax=Secundilactobacillus collinoides TaxID=33960 RepID=UPI000AED4B17|nr:DUF554 domain-containing protein [Secundilactobacillus collinoides]